MDQPDRRHPYDQYSCWKRDSWPTSRGGVASVASFISIPTICAPLANNSVNKNSDGWPFGPECRNAHGSSSNASAASCSSLAFLQGPFAPRPFRWDRRQVRVCNRSVDAIWACNRLSFCKNNTVHAYPVGIRSRIACCDQGPAEVIARRECSDIVTHEDNRGGNDEKSGVGIQQKMAQAVVFEYLINWEKGNF